MNDIVEAAMVQEAPGPDVGDGISNVARAELDAEAMSPADVSGLYEELQANVAGLSQAINTDAMLNAQEPQVQACNPTACTAEVKVNVTHADGVAMPAESSIAFTVHGKQAGECLADGTLPASGPGHLSCTDASPQWKAADAGRTVEPPTVFAVGNVVAKAVSPDELARINSQLSAQAGAIRANFIGSCDNLSELNGSRLMEVLDQLGIDNPAKRVAALCRQIKQPAPGTPLKETLTDAYVSDAQEVIARLPLGQLDPADAALAVQRVLSAMSVSRLYRILDVLRAAMDASQRVAPGTRILLFVNTDSVQVGTRHLDLQSVGLRKGPKGTDLDPTKGAAWIDLMYQQADGAVVAEQVLRDGTDVQNDPARVRMSQQTLDAIKPLGVQPFLNVLTDAGLDHFFRPLPGVVAGEKPTRELSATVPPRLLAQQPALVANFTNPPQTTYAFAAVLTANNQPTLPASNKLRSSNSKGHAEDNLIAEGDLLRAAQQAAAVGTPDHKASVLLAVTKTPCAGDRAAGQQDSCTRLLQKAWPATLAQLTDQQRQNLDPTLLVAVRGPYEGKNAGMATTTKALQALDHAGIRMQVLTVNGAPTEWGRDLANALRDLFPAAPTESTLIDGLASSGAELKVAGYDMPAAGVKAVAQAYHNTGTDSAKLTTVDQIRSTLDAELHRLGVCI